MQITKQSKTKQNKRDKRARTQTNLGYDEFLGFFVSPADMIPYLASENLRARREYDI